MKNETEASLKEELRALPCDVFGGVSPLDASVYPMPKRKPFAGVHPRVIVNGEILKKIKAVGATGENERAYRLMHSLSDEETDGVLLPPAEGKHYNVNFHVLHIIEACAFRYAVEGDAFYAYRAVRALHNYLVTVEIIDSYTAGGRDTKGYMNDAYNAWGLMMFITAEVYDWCYPILTENDRAFFIAAIENKVARGLEVGFPPTGQGAVTGHGSETQLLRDWLSFAIATYDESPDIYNFVMGRIESEYIDVREFYYRSEMHGQGNNYGPGRLNSDVIAQHLVRVGTGEDLFRVDLGRVMESFVHNLRPDGSMLRVGDDVMQRSDKYDLTNTANIFFYAAAVGHNSVLKGLAAELNSGLDIFLGKNQYDQYITPVQFLAYNDTSLPRGKKEDLPLAKYFGSPVGQIIARNGWGKDACLLYMKMGEYFTANHEHKDVGSFQIFLGGALAIDSGCYDRYGSVVHFSYTMSTLAHNSILIFDPAEDTGKYVNVGGQKSACNESETLADWLGKEYTHRADVLGHFLSVDKAGKPEVCYLSGDMTKAYTSKAENVVRSMLGVYTDDPDVPLLFFVCDRITASDPAFKKTFLLHMMEEPTVKGNVTAFSHGGGTLVNRTLLPSTADIAVVKGPYTGVAPDDAVTRCNDQSGASERGWGRVEISPEPGNKTDDLLNIMYVTGTGCAVASDYAEAVSFESDLLTGGSIMNVASFFAKDPAALTGGFTVTGEGEETVRYFVAGVPAGIWAVFDGKNQKIAEASADAESGLLMFKAPPGTYRILPAESN